MAYPMPRFAPVTTARRPVRSNMLVTRDLRGLSRLHVDEDLHGPAFFEVAERRLDLGEGHDPGDELAGRYDARADELDRGIEVGPLVDPGADDVSSRQKILWRSTGRGVGMDGHHDDRAPDLGQSGGGATAAAAPETSKTTSAPAPAVHSSSQESRSRLRGKAAKPSFAARALRVGSSSTTVTSPPKSLATVAMRSPIGPPPRTTTLSPESTSPRRTSWTATATGSIRAASRRSAEGGRRTRSRRARSTAAATRRGSRCR